MVTIKANHINGYVKCALIRTEAEAAGAAESLKSAGYWTDITVAEFTPRPKGRAR